MFAFLGDFLCTTKTDNTKRPSAAHQTLSTQLNLPATHHNNCVVSLQTKLHPDFGSATSRDRRGISRYLLSALGFMIHDPEAIWGARKCDQTPEPQRSGQDLDAIALMGSQSERGNRLSKQLCANH